VKLPALIALLTAATFFSATSHAAPETVLAKVNDHEITEAELGFAEAEIGSEISGVPDERRRRVLVEYLIEAHLMADAAEKADLAKGDDFEARLKYYRLRALRDAYFEKQIRDSVPDSEAKGLYDERVKGLPKQEEVRARHILVKTEDEAKNIRKELEDGGDFAALAVKHSQDRGGQDGGDLGYFTRGQMVKPFEDAAFALEAGKLSDPVKSDFGWHIIKVEHKRESQPPAFEDVKDQIKTSLIQAKLQGTVQALRSGAEIEIVDATLKTEAELAGKPEPAENAEEVPAEDSPAEDKAEKKQ
jgi:peptidyl-prolyl cis-trans isomerase C